MTKVFKRPEAKQSPVGKAFSFLKENGWIFGAVALLISIGTQYQLYLDRIVRVEAECRLSNPYDAPVEFGPQRSLIAFRARCAVRNTGAKATDLVEVRNGLSWQGGVFNQRPLSAADYERVLEILVNGEPFRKPVSLPPGLAAVVDVTLAFPVDKYESPVLYEKLAGCTKANSLSTREALKCLGINWTSYMRGEGRGSVEVPTSFADGIGATFFFSNNSYTFAELPFLEGWGWDCKSKNLAPVPKYAENRACGIQ